MGCNNVRIGDVASFRKVSVRPNAGTIYYCYSLPAFDNARKPEILDGSEILSNKLHVEDSDILVNKLNMRFKRIWPINNPHDNSVCSTEFVPLCPNDKINRDYLLYTLMSDDFTSTLSRMRTGTSGSHQRVKPEWILDYQFPLPSIEDQRKIGRCLSTLDQKIAINTRLNGYLEELFDSCFKQSLNMVDETWDTASLLDIADYKNGLAMQKFRPNIGDKGLPVLKIRELGQESCGKDAERCRSDIDESVTVHDGDLVFSWSGTLLLRFWAGGDAGLNQHLFKVTSEVYPSWFYYAWTKHHLARFTMLAKDRATTMGHIKRSALEESEVLLPPKEKLTMQTKCMQPIIDQVIANKIEVRKLAALRDALLPKLMSGEIDVSKIDLTQLNSHLLHHRMQHTARIKPRPPANLVKPRPKIKPNRKRGKAVLGLNPALCQSNK